VTSAWAPGCAAQDDSVEVEGSAVSVEAVTGGKKMGKRKQVVLYCSALSHLLVYEVPILDRSNAYGKDIKAVDTT